MVSKESCMVAKFLMDGPKQSLSHLESKGCIEGSGSLTVLEVKKIQPQYPSSKQAKSKPKRNYGIHKSSHRLPSFLIERLLEAKVNDTLIRKLGKAVFNPTQDKFISCLKLKKIQLKAFPINMLYLTRFTPPIMTLRKVVNLANPVSDDTRTECSELLYKAKISRLFLSPVEEIFGICGDCILKGKDVYVPEGSRLVVCIHLGQYSEEPTPPHENFCFDVLVFDSLQVNCNRDSSFLVESIDYDTQQSYASQDSCKLTSETQMT